MFICLSLMCKTLVIGDAPVCASLGIITFISPLPISIQWPMKCPRNLPCLLKVRKLLGLLKSIDWKTGNVKCGVVTGVYFTKGWNPLQDVMLPMVSSLFYIARISCMNQSRQFQTPWCDCCSKISSNWTQTVFSYVCSLMFLDIGTSKLYHDYWDTKR